MRLEELARRPILARARAALKSGESAWLVGGTLRDALLGVPLVDFDLAVDGPAGPFARRLAARLGGRPCFALDRERDIHRVVLEGAQVDVARVQGGGILEDLARRDFAANAMALPLGGGALLDPFGGREDCAKRLLRATSERVLVEDPLRLLRLFRLAARLGLTPEARTLRWARRHRALARRPAAERVRAELMALLEAPGAAAWLRAMDEARILTQVLPELEPSRACARSYYGPGGVLEHSLRTVERADFLLADTSRAFPGLREGLAGELGPGGAPLLKLGCLLHDVAKPECARRVKGRLRFFGHDERGAVRAKAALERLRFSREEADWVSTWVRHHLRPGNLAANEAISEKAVYRFFRDLGEKGVSQLLLCWTDHASYMEPRAVARGLAAALEPPGAPLPRWARGDVGKTLHHLRVVSFLLGRWSRTPGGPVPKKLLDGNEVMKALRLPPGPKVGEVLRELEEAQAVGKVSNRAQALAFVKGLRP